MASMQMKPILPIVLLLSCSALICERIVSCVGRLLPKYFQVAYRLNLGEVADFMPAPTRFACENAWAFRVALIFMLVASFVALYRKPAHCQKIPINGLCVQGTRVWIAMFCYCYEGFCGPVSLHTGPQFSLVEFMQFEGAIFPIALAGLAVPVAFSFVGKRVLPHC